MVPDRLGGVPDMVQQFEGDDGKTVMFFRDEAVLHRNNTLTTASLTSTSADVVMLQHRRAVQALQDDAYAVSVIAGCDFIGDRQ